MELAKINFEWVCNFARMRSVESTDEEAMLLVIQLRVNWIAIVS